MTERIIRSKKEKNDVKSFLSKKYGWVCWYCGQKLKGEIHLDHIEPVCAGGVDDESNLALACEYCNMAKADHSLDVFLEWLDNIRFGKVWTPIRDGIVKQDAYCGAGNGPRIYSEDPVLAQIP